MYKILAILILANAPLAQAETLLAEDSMFITPNVVTKMSDASIACAGDDLEDPSGLREINVQIRRPNLNNNQLLVEAQFHGSTLDHRDKTRRHIRLFPQTTINNFSPTAAGDESEVDTHFLLQQNADREIDTTLSEIYFDIVDSRRGVIVTLPIGSRIDRSGDQIMISSPVARTAIPLVKTSANPKYFSTSLSLASCKLTLTYKRIVTGSEKKSAAATKR